MDYANDPINGVLDRAAKVALYRRMLRSRKFEQGALRQYSWGDMGGFLMLACGQESIAVGVRSVMGPDDHSISGSRGIGHALAAGMELVPCMAELMGRTSGCCGGKGGMFSFFGPAHRFWGCHGVDGAQTALAVGLAFGLKRRESPGVAVCFLGEGTANQGVFHESLNLAGLFDLPVVFVIENNGFGMGTSVARSSRFRDCLARRAEGYAIAWDRFDDEDLYEIRSRVGVALARAREESRPTVLEIATCRYYGATVADSNNLKYRNREDLARRKEERDPLTLWGERLSAEGVLDEAGAKAILAEVREEVATAVELARSGPMPRVEDLTRNVYWEVDHDTAAGRSGRHFFSP